MILAATDYLADIGTLVTGAGTLLIGFVGIKTLSATRVIKGDVARNTVVSTEAQKAATRALGELETLNGKTVGKLADEGEGRRIDASTPADEQSMSERHYVAAVKESDAAEREQ